MQTYTARSCAFMDVFGMQGTGMHASASVRLPNGLGPGLRVQVVRRGRGRVTAYEQVRR